MCKNTGQPNFDSILKKPGNNHRLCNPFRITCFLPEPVWVEFKPN